MTQPEYPRVPDGAPPGARLEYAAPGLGRRPPPPLWQQMLEAFGYLVAGAVLPAAVGVGLDVAGARSDTEDAGATIAAFVAAAGVLFATHRRRAWRGLLFVVLLLAALALLAVGLCFAAFALM